MTDHKGTLLQVREALVLNICLLEDRYRREDADASLATKCALTKLAALIEAVPDDVFGHVRIDDYAISPSEADIIVTWCEAAKLLHDATTEKEE